MAEKKEAHHGKQPNQKMKPFIVMQYLQRNTDENHTCSSTDIIDYLNNECGISADRRSIYRDIAEINKAMYMIEQGVDIETAADDLEEYEDEKLIVYDPNRKGFYFRRREYEPNDVRLLVESVYASKFTLQETRKDFQRNDPCTEANVARCSLSFVRSKPFCLCGLWLLRRAKGFAFSQGSDHQP